MTEIVFDSSTLISLSEKCFLRLLSHIQEHADARFLISQSVWNESVQTPQKIRRFELNAEKIRQAVNENWLEIVKPDKKIIQWFEKIRELANHTYYINNKPLAILQAGEIDTMAIYKALECQAMAIDERTCRMLIEEPVRLQNYMSVKHDKKILINRQNLFELQKHFGNALIVRSCDLLAWTYRHGLFRYELDSTPEMLKAALYAVKYSGCSVSENEIKEYSDKG